MRGSRLLAEAVGQVWAIEPAKGRAIADFLCRQVSGDDIKTKRTPAGKEAKLRQDERGVAVIEMHGVLAQRLNIMDEISGGTSTSMLANEITAAANDSNVKAIFLHTDSPGGSVYGLPELVSSIRSAREKKPVIAQVDSLAASAGYWAASQATEVVASPGADVGSIGAYILHEDISQFLESEGVKETFIYAGKYKVDGNPYEPLSDSAKEYLQSRVDMALKDFITDVATGRGTSANNVSENFGQGRLVEARDALRRGMIDRVATPRETLARFFKINNNKKDKRKSDVERERRRLQLEKFK